MTDSTRDPGDLDSETHLDECVAAERAVVSRMMVDELAVLRGVVQRLSSQAAEQESVPRPSLRSIRRLSMPMAAAVGLLSVSLAAAAVGGYVAGRAEEPTRKEPAAERVPSVAGSVLDGTPKDAAPPAERESGRKAVIASPADARDSRLEPLLIEHARMALHRDLPAEAQRVLERHRTLFSEGQLSEERDVLLIETFVELGDHGQALAQIRAYHERYPSSRATLGARVQSIERELAARR